MSKIVRWAFAVENRWRRLRRRGRDIWELLRYGEIQWVVEYLEDYRELYRERDELEDEVYSLKKENEELKEAFERAEQDAWNAERCLWKMDMLFKAWVQEAQAEEEFYDTFIGVDDE